MVLDKSNDSSPVQRNLADKKDGVQYFLGCPMWANRDWLGSLFTKDTSGKPLLMQYSKVFTTVEGNTTFYALPKKSTVMQWNEYTPDNFRFTFKLPKSVTHSGQLRANAELQRFFDVLEPLQEKLAQVWIQLPPHFTLASLPQLESLMASLPANFRYAVEVRHLSFYDQKEGESRWQDWLRQHQVNWVHFDTKALFELRNDADAQLEESVLEAFKVKPAMPERFVATADSPMLRFIAANTVQESEARLQFVVQKVAGWIKEGRQPYVMVHTPDCIQAPQLARRFHELLSERVQIRQMLPWEGESEAPPPQLSLF